MANDLQPLETGEDGRAALEIIFAAYESARTGRRIDFPYDPPAWARSPIQCWKPWLSPDCPEELREEGRWRERGTTVGTFVGTP